MRIIIIILLLGLSAGVNAQRERQKIPVSRIISRIPDSLTRSTKGIAGYINSRFSTQGEKARAIFIWIAKNIEYNFDSMFDNSIYETPTEVSERILSSRVGVCLQYAYLFNEIANMTGIKSFVVQGYTKQHGVVDVLPHIWCVAYIDSAWCMIDPTWGSGFVSRGRYVKQVNFYYFMTKPEDMIRSHMPFDPLWQLLHHPVTNREFYQKSFRIDTSRAFFSFPDTLHAYEHSTEIEQIISSAGRIEQNGVENVFIAAKLRVLKGKIEYYRNQAIADKYNNAVSLYNDGIIKLNKFIGYRNRQFESEWDSIQLTCLLDSAEYYFATADKSLIEIRDPEENIAESILKLNKAIRETWMVLNEQRYTLLLYLKTWK